MKKQYTPAQIKTIKTLCPWEITSFHGNTRKVKGIPKDEFIEIVRKKRDRMGRSTPRQVVSNAQKVKELIQDAKRRKGTPYFKTLIEGNTGIYYASPVYGHRDYNKSRVMDKTPNSLKLMQIFNKAIEKRCIMEIRENQYFQFVNDSGHVVTCNEMHAHTFSSKEDALNFATEKGKTR